MESLSGGMVDAEDLKSSDRKIVRVQVPSRAPRFEYASHLFVS